MQYKSTILMNPSLKLLAFILLIFAISTACTSGKKTLTSTGDIEVITINSDESGIPIEVIFRKGTAHNHPLMAIWLEDMDGNYLETLYVAKSIGSGIFGHGIVKKGHWEPGPVSRPAALPYWWHKYGELPNPESPVPDAISGPTPDGDFILKTKAESHEKDMVNILFEINQSWDWNEYWTNDKYPDNEDYKTSSQPAVVYQASIDLSAPGRVYELKIIGHSHYAGEDGSLTTDIGTLTTALEIVGVIKVSTGVK